MSRPRHKRSASVASGAAVFAALGDETRLRLVSALSLGSPLSIARLAENSPFTRQAVTKHLLVLQRAGLVRCVRHGRESRFVLREEALDEALRSLEVISRQWDAALTRLKALVEG
jgi:DNA-binding transcriptional ArsR family regulator